MYQLSNPLLCVIRKLFPLLADAENNSTNTTKVNTIVSKSIVDWELAKYQNDETKAHFRKHWMVILIDRYFYCNTDFRLNWKACDHCELGIDCLNVTIECKTFSKNICDPLLCALNLIIQSHLIIVVCQTRGKENDGLDRVGYLQLTCFREAE